jgi:heme/copper-type cytochrome/quinol oxidase subunit 2
MPGAIVFALSVLGAASQTGSVKVVASKDGFRPSQITIRKGEAIRLVLSTADDEHCFALDALRIEKRLVPGKTVNVDIGLEKVGSFPFHCCLEQGPDAIHGEIRVTE